MKISVGGRAVAWAAVCLLVSVQPTIGFSILTFKRSRNLSLSMKSKNSFSKSHGFGSGGGRGAAKKPAARSGGWTRKAAKSATSSKTRQCSNSTTLKSESSRSTTGLFTRQGAPVQNVQNYVKAGGKTYNRQGRYIQNGQAYANTVSHNSIQTAAQRVQRTNPAAKGFTYCVEDTQGRRYVGATEHPTQRIAAHLNGNGAKATQQMSALKRVEIVPQRTSQAAYRYETKLYHSEKAKHGGEKVRGAGNTKPWTDSKSQK